VQRGEGLASAGVDDGQRELDGATILLADAGGEDRKGPDPDQGQLAPRRQGARGGDPDAQAGERPRADADCDPIDAAPAAGGRHRAVDRDEQPGGMRGPRRSRVGRA